MTTPMIPGDGWHVFLDHDQAGCEVLRVICWTLEEGLPAAWVALEGDDLTTIDRIRGCKVRFFHPDQRPY